MRLRRELLRWNVRAEERRAEKLCNNCWAGSCCADCKDVAELGDNKGDDDGPEWRWW
jgi:hypothetical protein